MGPSYPAQCNLVPFEIAHLLSLQDGIGGQIGAIVDDQHMELAMDLGEPLLHRRQMRSIQSVRTLSNCPGDVR